MATAAFALAGVAAATFAATVAATVAATLPLLLLLLSHLLDPLCLLPAQPLDASLFALPPLFGSPGSALSFALAVVVSDPPRDQGSRHSRQCGAALHQSAAACCAPAPRGRRSSAATSPR